MDNSGFVIAGERNINMWRLLSMKAALKLECAGLKHSRGSVYGLVKREFGFKGNKASVLAQLTAHIESLQEVA